MEAAHRYYVSEDLVLKILLPQPVKSLLRFKCVCKRWNQVINNESFIKSHAAYQRTSPDANKYLLLHSGGSYTTSLIGSGSHEYDLHDIFGKASDYKPKVYGICDGLICLSDGNCLSSISPIILWNPIARKGKKLPPLGFHHYATTNLCFGYYNNDYKVIHVLPYIDSYHVYIYSLSTDKWKLIKFDKSNYNEGYNGFENFIISSFPNGRLVNGVAYFLRYSLVGPADDHVVFFDLSHEITGEINLPDDFYHAAKFIMEEYRESIALIGFSRSTHDVVMWVLRESDNSFSWDKMFITGTEDINYTNLMCFINNNELLINTFSRSGSTWTEKCTLYNVENGFQQEVTSTLNGSEEDIIHDYTESLVLLNETPVPLLKMQPC